MEKIKKGVRLENISKIYKDPKTGKPFYAVKDTYSVAPLFLTSPFILLLNPSSSSASIVDPA